MGCNRYVSSHLDILDKYVHSIANICKILENSNTTVAIASLEGGD